MSDSNEPVHEHRWSEWSQRHVTETFIGMTARDGHGQRRWTYEFRICECGAEETWEERPRPPMLIHRPGLIARMLDFLTGGRWP